MKGRKIIAVLLAITLLCAGIITSAGAVEPTYYEKQLAKFELMKHKDIDFLLRYTGGYVTKEAKVYGREVVGVNLDGSFILSPWKQLKNYSSIITFTDISFKLPATYVSFAYSFDIVWGTDWPFSGIFWNNPDQILSAVKIDCFGTVRDACIRIAVDNKTILEEYGLDSHSEWKP